MPVVIYYCTVHSWFDRPHFYQGLARALARNHSVLYVCPPRGRRALRPHRDDARPIRGGLLSQLAPRLVVLEPLIAPGARFYRRVDVFRRRCDDLVARTTLAAMQELELDRPEFILAFAPDATALLARFGDARSAYWTGDEVTMPREDELVQRVDVVFAVSGPAYQRNIARAARRVHRMPMAIDPEPFVTAAELGATPPDLVGLPRPFIGYGGGMSRRMNWELIAEVARHATGTVVLVGPVLDGVARVAIAGLIKRDNVRWLGHRDAEAVPHYLATLDVGLIPYVRNAFNDGSNPVKAYEYLAAGIPVVGTCIPSLVELGELIDCEDDPERFVAAVAAAARPERRAPELVARRRLAARAHDYTALVRRIHDVLGGRDANGT